MSVRVLHIGKYYPPVPGGMERFLGDLVKAQRAAGHDVGVLVHEDRPTGAGSRPESNKGVGGGEACSSAASAASIRASSFGVGCVLMDSLMGVLLHRASLPPAFQHRVGKGEGEGALDGRPDDLGLEFGGAADGDLVPIAREREA